MSTNGQLETGPTFYELEHGHGQVLRMLKLASTNEIPGFVATDQSQASKLITLVVLTVRSWKLENTTLSADTHVISEFRF